MDNIVSLENTRLMGNYRSALEDSKNNNDTTITRVCSDIDRRVEIATTLLEVKSIYKEAAFIRYIKPEIYEYKKRQITPKLMDKLALPNTTQSRIDMNKVIEEAEAEVVDILGFNKEVVTELDIFRKRFAADYRNERIVDLEGGVFDDYKFESFRQAFNVPRIPIGDRDKTLGIGTYVLTHCYLRQIDGYVIDPIGDVPLIEVWDRGLHRVTHTRNNWYGFKSELVKAAPIDNPEKNFPALLKHLKRATSGKADQLNLLLDYGAHIVQKPWEKPGWGILLMGKEGCGKDTIARVFGKLVHANHYVEIGDVEFKNSEKTAWRKGIVVALVTEFSGIDRKNRPHVYQTLESSVARIRGMYKDFYTMNCVMRTFMTANPSYGNISATENSRRIFMPDFNDELAFNVHEGEEFQQFRRNELERLNAEIGGDNMNNITPGIIAFYQYLKQRDISKFNVKTPDLMTQALEEMIEENESALNLLRDDIIIRGRLHDHSEFSTGLDFILKEHEDNYIREEDMRAIYIGVARSIRANTDTRGLPNKLLTALGLPWDGKKNNRTYHGNSAGNQMYYKFPSLTRLRRMYYTAFPYRKPPA